MSLKTDIIVVGVAGVVILAAGWYAKKKLGAALTTAAPYVNPLDSRNLAYSGVNAVGGALTGEAGFTLGGWIYDITHPGVAGNNASPYLGHLGYDIPENFGLINPSEGW
jgi:hypothetical protein